MALSDDGGTTVGTGRGAGGDESLVFDRGAEDAIFVELEALPERGREFTAISEERGEVTYGSGASPVRVVVDPIDGSLNAKRLIPSYCVSIAVSAGDTMEDVRFAFVHHLGNGEEFTATLHGGAQLNGEPVEPEPAGDGEASRWSAWSRRARTGSCRRPAAQRLRLPAARRRQRSP